MSHRSPGEGGDVAALVSGGSDSAVLAVDLLRSFDRVWPIYVRFGLRWEEPELAGLREFLDALDRPGLMPLTVLDEPVADVYGDHWSTGGPGVPDAESRDEDVHLPGRTLLLAAKAAVWCRIRGIETLAVGTLASNPFPDSTPVFDRAFEAVVGDPFRLIRPFAGLDKADVLRRGAGLPLWRTFSCLEPVDGLHCGRCNKCGERRRGFREQGRADRTTYASDLAASPRRPVPCSE
jgi:7-cyano-7-deazaguanine synthase